MFKQIHEVAKHTGPFERHAGRIIGEYYSKRRDSDRQAKRRRECNDRPPPRGPTTR